MKVLGADGSGSFAGVMAGMQWTIDTMHQYNTRIASMSLGGLALLNGLLLRKTA